MKWYSYSKRAVRVRVPLALSTSTAGAEYEYEKPLFPLGWVLGSCDSGYILPSLQDYENGMAKYATGPDLWPDPLRTARRVAYVANALGDNPGQAD